MDTVDQFAEEATRFEAWTCRSEPDEGLAVREALLRITNLYLAAFQLPHPFSEVIEETPDAEQISSEECNRVIAFQTLPIGLYSKVFDPLALEPEEPVGGILADDIIDIYRDVVGGLRAYQSGNRAGAIWEWGFNFQVHWGTHAVSAMSALHAWLASNDAERFYRET